MYYVHWFHTLQQRDVFLLVILRTCEVMGCAPSTAKAVAPNAPPELAGKSKFLSCPVTCEIQHPSSGETYMIVCFAPLHPPYGLVVAARNVVRRTDPVLVKDVTDAELAKEKEQFKISMSWNVVFKAIATEIARCNKGGATCVFSADGSLEIELRVALTGLSNQSKKTDMYKMTLEPLPPTTQRIYKYFVAPIATLYGKKKTDLLEKPDPAKEKVLGELEATLVVKEASMRRCLESIAVNGPKIRRFREQLDDVAAKRALAVARVALLSQMVWGRVAEPKWLQADLRSCPVEYHADPLAVCLYQQPHSNQHTDRFSSNDVPAFPAPVESQNPLLAAFFAAERDWDCVAILPKLLSDKGLGVAPLAAYMLWRFMDRQQRSDVSDAAVWAICIALEQKTPRSPEFFSHKRAVLVAAAYLYLLCAGDVRSRLHVKGVLLTSSILSACGCFLHHDGTSNKMQCEARTFLSSMYPEGALQLHSAACLADLLQEHDSHGYLWSNTTVHTIVGATSYLDPPGATTADYFTRRASEIKDFSRYRSDKVLAASAAVTLCCAAHIFLPQEYAVDWQVLQADAAKAAQRVYGLHGIASSPVGSTWWDDCEGALSRLAGTFRTIFPSIQLSLSGSSPGLFVEAPSFAPEFSMSVAR